MLVDLNTYQCSPCHSDDDEEIKIMFETNDLFGSIVCKGDNLDCILDGEGTRQILEVDGTGASMLIVKGIRFYRGDMTKTRDSRSGGGLGLSKKAIVELQFCAFEACNGFTGGAIYILAGCEMVIYGTFFTANTVTSTQGGDDIHNGGRLAISDSCPENWTGFPQKGKTTAYLPPP